MAMQNIAAKNWSIRQRLLIGFSAIVLVIFLSTGTALHRADVIKKTADQFIDIAAPLHDETTNLYAHIYQMQASLHSMLLAENHNDKTEFLQVEQTIDEIQTNIDDTVNLLDDKSISEQWHTLKSDLNELRVLNGQVINTADNTQAIAILLTKVNPVFNKIVTLLDGAKNENGVREGGLLAAEYVILQNNAQIVKQDLKIIVAIQYTILISGIIISLIIIYLTSRSIIQYINLIRAQSARIASGDLTQRIAVMNDDEMGQLCQDLNSMTDSLAKMTKLVNDASQNMVASLSEVRQSASVQSSGASEQASSINEITASLEEIEKSSDQTNEKARALGETAERSRAKGQQGLEAVSQSIGGMKIVREKVQMIAQTILDLSNQTQQVGEITAVVNNLAQQSKMLALNASIEAVKAGEAGKGFSIVATEVKNLAERSEQSTVQVQKILENIRHTAEKAVMVTEEGTKGVDLGTNLVEQTGEIVRELTEVINESSIASQQIEAAIRQESVGIEQITIGMNEINQVTASFVASTKQTTEAIEHLFTIAKEIKEYISVYKIDTNKN